MILDPRPKYAEFESAERKCQLKSKSEQAFKELYKEEYYVFNDHNNNNKEESFSVELAEKSSSIYIK